MKLTKFCLRAVLFAAAFTGRNSADDRRNPSVHHDAGQSRVATRYI